MSDQEKNPASEQYEGSDLSENRIQPQEGPISNEEIEAELNLEAQLAEVTKDLSEMVAKHAEVAEAYIRAKAEVENIRKRAVEEESKARRFAAESFAKAMLPVKDSLEAALKTPDQSLETLTEGVETTLKQLINAFEMQKVEAISPAIGDKLDPNLHQAMAVLPSAEHEPNTIMDVLQTGYTLSGRMLRPAMVIVSTAAN